jgi:hypothetical protein
MAGALRILELRLEVSPFVVHYSVGFGKGLPVRRWATRTSRWPFVFSGKELQPALLDLPAGVAPQFCPETRLMLVMPWSPVSSTKTM